MEGALLACRARRSMLDVRQKWTCAQRVGLAVPAHFQLRAHLPIDHADVQRHCTGSCLGPDPCEEPTSRAALNPTGSGVQQHQVAAAGAARPPFGQARQPRFGRRTGQDHPAQGPGVARGQPLLEQEPAQGGRGGSG